MARVGRLHLHERLVHELAASSVERVGRRDLVVRADALDGLDAEAAREHAQAAVERSARSRRAGRGSRRAWRAASAAVVSPARLPPRSSASASPRRAEICAGDSAAARAAASSSASGMPSSRRQMLRHRRGVVGAEREAGRRLGRALAEEPDRLGLLELRAGVPLAVGQRQRRHPPRHLAGDAQALAARGQDAQVRAGAQQPVGERARRRRSGARSCPARAAPAARRPARPAPRRGRGRSAPARPARRPPPPARAPDRRPAPARPGHTPSSNVGRLARGQLERQPRLAAAARPGERQQARAVRASFVAARPARARGRRSW